MDDDEDAPRGAHPDADATFGDVFEDLLKPEVHRVLPLWTCETIAQKEAQADTEADSGAAAGAVLGFIAGNLPGARASRFSLWPDNMSRRRNWRLWRLEAWRCARCQRQSVCLQF